MDDMWLDFDLLPPTLKALFAAFPDTDDERSDEDGENSCIDRAAALVKVPLYLDDATLQQVRRYKNVIDDYDSLMGLYFPFLFLDRSV